MYSLPHFGIDVETTFLLYYNILIFVRFFKLIILCRFFETLFLPDWLSFYPINMEFGHHIPRVVGRCAMTFLSHSACSSGIIQDFLDHSLECQKAVSAYL